MEVITACLCAKWSNLVERNFFYNTEKRYLQEKRPPVGENYLLKAVSSSVLRLPARPQGLPNGSQDPKVQVLSSVLRSKLTLIFESIQGYLLVRSWMSHERLLNVLFINENDPTLWLCPLLRNLSVTQSLAMLSNSYPARTLAYG